MSAPWKGWMRPMDKWGPEGDDDRIGVVRPVLDRQEAAYTSPVLVCPIGDESLPHPGDGKEWEWEEDPVEVVSPVFVGGHWIAVAMVPGKELRIAPIADLRERKPEPEDYVWIPSHRARYAHRDWCPIARGEWSTWPTQRVRCTCERRSGVDRREGERRVGTSIHAMTGGRRRSWSPAINKGALHSNALVRGRRSGTDRRRP